MLTGLQISAEIASPPLQFKHFVWVYFLLIWVGVATGNVVTDQPSV